MYVYFTLHAYNEVGLYSIIYMCSCCESLSQQLLFDDFASKVKITALIASMSIITSVPNDIHECLERIYIYTVH